jgi:hypothetical protein
MKKYQRKEILEVAEKNNIKVPANKKVEEQLELLFNGLKEKPRKEMDKETRKMFFELDTYFKRANRPIRVQEHTKRAPGVVEVIVRSLLDAGKQGISKSEIHNLLVAKFPDRDPEKMKHTVNLHVPSCITRERFDVERIPDTDKYRKAN